MQKTNVAFGVDTVSIGLVLPGIHLVNTGMAEW